jgi:hypothetical protein
MVESLKDLASKAGSSQDTRLRTARSAALQERLDGISFWRPGTTYQLILFVFTIDSTILSCHS